MRLVRLGEGTSEIGVDVRAALASWGRGDNVVGGIALTGAQPPGCPRPVDAVLVLPRGVIVVVGADLPDPAVRLDAPLSGQWKTDGWPLVRGDGAVNPAVEALEAAGAITAHLERSRVEPLPVATVVAVGPYVSQVFQPTTDLQRGVRILHPEPMTLLTATRELAVCQRECSADGAKRVLAALSADAPEVAALDLGAEGFADTVAPGLTAASTTFIPRVADAPPAPARPPKVRRGRNRLHWLPMGAAILVALLLVTGIVLAVASAGSSRTEATHPAAATPTTPAGIPVEGSTFLREGVSRDADCAAHAYGDLQTWLQRNKCTQLIRLRYESSSDSHKAAILVAVLRFATSTMADDLEKLAGKTGSGAITDVSTEGVAWPDGGKPFFESAAYASGREGASVKLVQAVWMDQPSAPDDVVLRSLASKALQLPVED